MVDEDKYPSDSERRRFVKGVVGGSALSTLGAAGVAGLNAATRSPGEGGGATEVMVIENTAGPAPRGMPQIPVEIVDGELVGVWPEVREVERNDRTVTVAESKLGGVSYNSRWFQYCGLQTYAGIAPDYQPTDGNYFHAGPDPDYDWQDGMAPDERFAVEQFDDYETWGNGIGVAGLGKPASATWRSLGADQRIPVQFIRSPVVEELVASGSVEGADGETYEVDEATRRWLAASTAKGFLAWVNKCTHLCCVPEYKGFAASARFEAQNEVYCSCHQSVYEPFSVVRRVFTALPRPDE